VLQQPLRHGVNLVLHSATKGIGGHNDATIGVVAGEAELLDAVWAYSVLHGSVASPFDAMNALRGIRTLPVRVARQCQSAEQLARFLEQHAGVERVWYPGLDSHPQRDVAKRQMSAGGTLLAVEIAGGIDGGRRFTEGLRLARMAASLGGPETLVAHPASSTHASLRADELAAGGITPGMVRISVGLEHPDDLQADFAQALAG
jgi:cystathionine beta-lyase/cystathionine gamma-synthase